MRFKLWTLTVKLVKGWPKLESFEGTMIDDRCRLSSDSYFDL